MVNQEKIQEQEAVRARQFQVEKNQARQKAKKEELEVKIKPKIQDESDKESRFSRELRSEKASSKRLEEKQEKLGKEKSQKAKGEGGALAKRMAKSAQSGSDWPFIFAIIISGIDDFIDICDVGLGVGVDQFLDFFVVVGIIATRAFIKGQPGWWTIRIVVFILELMPGVGILPLWTLVAIHSWQKAKKMRQ